MTTAAVLRILVTANTAQATAALARTDTQLKKTAVTAQGASTSMGAKIAKGAKVGGLALAALAAVSIKAAADWESAFAEVRKTVDTSEKGFKRLEKGLRGLAKEIPISAVELANLAGQAGALGIKAKDIVKFTKTAAELGITTDLSAEAAANALARLSNIMGTSSKDFRRLGSTMVELGNKGASTESEIAEMALRIAGAGKVIGLTEADVLGFSSALASVGVRAEAGGSAISRAFITIAEAAEKGGGELRGFADVAGLSVGKFGQMFKKDAASAMVLFIEGLDKIRKSGGDVFGTLEKLNLNEIRVRDSLLRAAGAGDLFRKALKTGSDEWARNTALTEEANKRYNTTAAQFQIFKNRVTDVFISIGQFLNPAVRGLLKLLNTLSFKDIIADIKRFVRTNEEMRAFLQSVRNIATVLKTVFGPVVREVFRQARIVVGNLLDAFQGLLQGMRGIVRIITGLLTGDFRLAWRGVKDIFSGGAKFVVGVMRAMVTPVLAPLRILGKAMREIFKTTWAAIKDIFKSGLDAIIGFVNTIIGVINAIPGVPDIPKVGAGGRVSGPTGPQGPIGRQRGGPIFGGQPSGDTVPAMLERGEYVLNRKAVAAVGRKQLDAVNFASAPRYAIGGAIGNAIGGAADLVGKGAGYFLGKLPKPNLPDPFGALGPYLIGEVSNWIKDGFQSKKMGSFTGLGGYTGPPANFSQLGDNRWVDSHTMAVGAYMARKFGVSITDGWRPQNAGYGAANSSHKRGTPANPGAIDFAPSSRAFQSYAGKHIAGLTENLYNDPYSTGPHNHLAFFRKGGLVPGFATGGSVKGGRNSMRSIWDAMQGMIGKGAGYSLNLFGGSGVSPWEAETVPVRHGSIVSMNELAMGALTGGGWKHRRALELTLHELAHVFQSRNLTTAGGYDVRHTEGGAQAWVRLFGQKALQRAGVEGRPTNTMYPGVSSWVLENMPREWIERTQFGMQRGGLVPGFARGGMVNLDALVGGSRGWDVNERATLAHVAGQKNPGLMAAISMMEAPNNLGGSKANGPPDGRGLWQIEWPVWSSTMMGKGLSDAYNAWQNARMAKVVQDEQGLGAWVVYNNSAYGSKGSVMGALAGRMRDVISGGSGGGKPAAPKPPTTTAGGVGPPPGTPGGTTAGAWGGTYEAGPGPGETNFGSLPSNLAGCMIEMNRLRAQIANLRARRAKAKANKAPASTLAQFDAAIKKVEARYLAVKNRRDALAKAQMAAIRAKIAKVGQMPDWEAAVNRFLAPEGLNALAQEKVDRLLTLEPLEFASEADFLSYMTQERNAYGGVLGNQMLFRSTLLGGESVAGQRLNTTVNPAIAFIQAALADKRFQGQWPNLRARLADWRGARTGLNSLIGSWDGELIPLQGAGSTRAWMAAAPELGVLGGNILGTQITMRDLGLRKWEAPFTDSGVGGDGGSGAPDRSAEIELLRQLLEQAQRTILTGNLQSPVGLDFAGYYAQGGPIPGPIGKPYAAVVHGGEEVLTRAQRRGGPIVVQLIVEDGAVDINKIRAVASDEVQVELRKVARGIQTSSPSSVGRQTAVG